MLKHAFVKSSNPIKRKLSLADTYILCQIISIWLMFFIDKQKIVH